MSSTSVWIEKLVTKEDPLHVHKTLGILVLCSYTWRILLSPIFGSSDFGFESHPSLTIPTLLLHLTLNLSAFEFRIPASRITTGYRIWPEYRLHSLVFLCRSLVSMTVTWVEQTYGQLSSRPLVDLTIVLCSMAAADLASWTCGPHHSRTIRDLQAPRYVRYFFSVMQFFATCNILFSIQRMSIPFIHALVIQGNAFLMTLRRKNLASQSTLVAIYGIGLVVGGLWTVNETVQYGGGLNALLISILIVSSVALIRLGQPPLLPGIISVNKYVLWTAMGLLLQRLRPLISSLEDNKQDALLSEEQLQVLAPLSFAMMLLLGYYKSVYGHHQRQQKDDQIKKVD